MTACDRIAQQMGERFVCLSRERDVRIRTPFLYPDGDIIDVFLVDRGDTLTLTDFGESLRWLKMQTPSARRSPKQRQIIQDVCLNHGVELFKGMLSLRTSRDRLADGVLRLSQAAMRVADIWFTFRTRAIQSITDEVADFLSERSIPYQRGEKLPGRSGRIWTPDFHTRTPDRSSLVYVLTTGSRAAARGVAEHVVAAWHDLSHLSAGAEPMGFVSLFDDTVDVWADEDFKLVESLSNVARWSSPDDFERLLAAA